MYKFFRLQYPYNNLSFPIPCPTIYKILNGGNEICLTIKYT